MIKLFYNFKTDPFQKDIKVENIFLSAAGRELSQRLEYMKQKRGLMVLTGMPGVANNKKFILSGQPDLRDKLLNLMHQAFNQRIFIDN